MDSSEWYSPGSGELNLSLGANYNQLQGSFAFIAADIVSKLNKDWSLFGRTELGYGSSLGLYGSGLLGMRRKW